MRRGLGAEFRYIEEGVGFQNTNQWGGLASIIQRRESLASNIQRRGSLNYTEEGGAGFNYTEKRGLTFILLKNGGLASIIQRFWAGFIYR